VLTIKRQTYPVRRIPPAGESTTDGTHTVARMHLTNGNPIRQRDTPGGGTHRTDGSAKPGGGCAQPAVIMVNNSNSYTAGILQISGGFVTRNIDTGVNLRGFDKVVPYRYFGDYK